jgi:hypothetical protein
MTPIGIVVLSIITGLLKYEPRGLPGHNSSVPLTSEAVLSKQQLDSSRPCTAAAVVLPRMHG